MYVFEAVEPSREKTFDEARAELIVEDTDAAPQVQNSAKIIINCAEQVTKLVRQLLDFARPPQALQQCHRHVKVGTLRSGPKS